MKKVILFTSLIILLLIIGCSTAYKSLTVVMPDLALIKDGIYRGNYDMPSTPVKATVNVIVQNHQINKIDILEHFCSPIGKKAEKIIDSIIEHQSLDVDVISGATASSKTLLKAVENALNN
ncbi:MAG: FMN-binding protein [Treponema sp.]|jgi:uncharacterized protein with FMN-binding domain|nr:FMN-binding protein [Treponema sp.]